MVLNQIKNYPFNTPKTLEQLHYRMIFQCYFGNDCDKIIPKFWMPNFIEATDASARTLNIYKEKLNESDKKECDENNEVILE